MSNVLHYINLAHRTDRNEFMKIELSEQEIEGMRWDGIIYGESFTQKKIGINLAHKKIIQYAKENKLPYVRIAEDDLRFFKGDAWKFYLDNQPESFDIYFGMIYLGKIGENNRLLSEASGFTLYTVHERFYDAFLGVPEKGHIDRTVTALYKDYEFYVCPEFVCEQRMSKSDNNGTTVDLRRFLHGRKIFGDPKLYELPL